MVAKKDWAEEERKAKKNWLKEHLPYELKMMRHSLRRLNEVPRPWFLDWNAFLASFCVSAGNLTAFLTNKEGKNNFRACDFVKNVRSRKTDELKTPFVKLEPHVFHLGKFRATDEERDAKFNLDDAKLIAQWIETEIAKFIKQLPPGSPWDDDGSKPPEPPKGPTITIGEPAPQSASSHVETTKLQGYSGYQPNRK